MTDQQWYGQCTHDRKIDVITMYAWADEREEQGDELYAAALRLLADNGYRPYESVSGEHYNWYKAEDSDLYKYPSLLPEPLYEALTSDCLIGNDTKCYPTFRDAVLDLYTVLNGVTNAPTTSER